METRLQFNPNDREIQDFFKILGVPVSAIRKGEMTEAEMRAVGLDPRVMTVVALEDVTREGRIVSDVQLAAALSERHDVYLPAELSRADVRLVKKGLAGPDGFKFKALLTFGSLPDDLAAKRIYENLRGHETEFKKNMEQGVDVESKSSLTELLDAGFDLSDVIGTHFQERTVPEWGEVLPAVIPIIAGDIAESWRSGGEPGQGSGVIVSPYGHVMTADHVIWEGEEISPNLQIFYEGLSYPVEDILYANPDTHIAVLQIPELAFEENLTYVPFAESAPEVGEPIVAVGYPSTAIGQHDVYGPKLLTPGLMGETQIDSMIHLATELEGVPSVYAAETIHAFHISSARVFKGDSGGAYLNQYGELYGITCYMDQQNLVSYAASVISAETLDPELKAILSEIAALQ